MERVRDSHACHMYEFKVLGYRISIRSQCPKLTTERDRNLILDGQRVFSSSGTCVHVKVGDVVMADQFSSKRNDKYNLEQKQNLGKLCLKYKLEAEAVPKKLGT